jgi:catechol 2,3-dioxygenase-like lactoylglutathione lyase family enzyme
MHVTASAVSLTVADPEASARFLEGAFGFERKVEDPNGVIIQLVQWVAAPPQTAVGQ